LFPETGNIPLINLPANLPDIVYAEYFIDSDPGMGLGNSIPVPNPSPNVTDLVFEVDQSSLIMGNHLLFLRTRDETNRWSLTLVDEFCHSPQAVFSADDVWLGNETTFTDQSTFTDVNTEYYWDVDGDNVTDYTYDHSFTHTYAAAGTYAARLILISAEGCPDTTYQQVNVYTCSQPSNLAVTDTTDNSAILHWDPANIETEWNIEYGLAGFTLGEGTLISSINSNAYQLTGLGQNTSYDFYVRSACPANEFSSWEGPGNFITLEGGPCANPSDGGTIAASQAVCPGANPDPFTSVSPASGQTGILEYKWQKSIDNVVFEDIPASNTEGLAYSNSISDTTWFKRLARVDCMSDWIGAAESNTIQVDVGRRDRYRTKASGDWNDPTVWEYYNGTQWTDAVNYPSVSTVNCTNPVATVQDGDTITVATNISFGNVKND